MGKVKVYQYTILDTDVVERRKGRRRATREAIEALNKDTAEIIESSGVLVDETALNRSGFTALDFDPRH
jgi:hypothetical protein